MWQLKRLFRTAVIIVGATLAITYIGVGMAHVHLGYGHADKALLVSKGCTTDNDCLQMCLALNYLVDQGYSVWYEPHQYWWETTDCSAQY